MALAREFKKGKLAVRIYDSRVSMGAAAARDTAATVRSLLKQKNEINMIFAAAPSQNEMLAALVAEKDIDWTRVNAFHMDEYIGLSPDAPQGFGNFLKERIFSRLSFKTVHYLNGQCVNSEAECQRYSALLEEFPVDVVCLGIGENGHIAFNDPAVANFRDPKPVKTVELDSVCRSQQVHDGCFKKLDDVPMHALTLTVPALTRGAYLFCVVPAATKAQAVRSMVEGEVTQACPASILRLHENAVLYLDPESSSLLKRDAQ